MKTAFKEYYPTQLTRVYKLEVEERGWGPPESICRSRLTLFIEAIKTLHFSSQERRCFFAEQEK
jgi:hypothetical protein